MTSWCVPSLPLVWFAVGGGTRTNEAIDEAAVTLYDTGRGARSDARKVMILVTDGYSRYPSRTANSAYTVSVSHFSQ